MGRIEVDEDAICQAEATARRCRRRIEKLELGVDSGSMAVTTGEVRWEGGSEDGADFVSAPSGFGDGVYPLLVLVDPDGTTCGLEVDFLAEEDEVEEIVVTPPPYSHRPKGLAIIEVLASAPQLHVGDPCYGEPSATVDVPAGRYGVISWFGNSGPYVVTARIGVYRLSD